MNHRTSLAAILILLSSGAPATLNAQDTPPILVRLQVAEKSEGVFRQGFSEALEDLEGVEVVEGSRPAHYAVNVTVVCLPESEVCGAADSYSVSVVLSEPLAPVALRNGLRQTGDPVLSDWEASPEAESYLQRYQQMHAVWATLWGRDRYREQIGRLIRGIDTRCFEKRRLLEARRAVLRRRGESEAARNLTADAVAEGRWLC